MRLQIFTKIVWKILRKSLLESDYDQDYKIVIGGDFNAPLNFQLEKFNIDRKDSTF